MPARTRKRDTADLTQEIDALRQIIQRLVEVSRRLDDPQELAKVTNAISASSQRLADIIKAFSQLNGPSDSNQEELEAVLSELGK